MNERTVKDLTQLRTLQPQGATKESSNEKQAYFHPQNHEKT